MLKEHDLQVKYSNKMAYCTVHPSAAVPRYGYGIKLNEIVTLTENDYSEREIAFIEPKWDKKLKGVHTLCHENRLTMIDGYWNILGV